MYQTGYNMISFQTRIIKKETEKAICVTSDDLGFMGRYNRDIWLPKSQISITEMTGAWEGTFNIEVPIWLARDKDMLDEN